jgi:hypothetical protein
MVFVLRISRRQRAISSAHDRGTFVLSEEGYVQIVSRVFPTV